MRLAFWGAPIAASGAVTWGATGEPGWGALAGAAGYVVLAIGVFVSRLLSVPATMDAEAKKELSSYRDRLGEPFAFDVHCKHAPHHESWYVRLCVTNASSQPVLDCHANFIGFLRRLEDGALERVEYDDTMPLTWAQEPQVERATLAPGSTHRVGVVRSGRTTGLTIAHNNADQWFRPPQEPAEYVATVEVLSGDGRVRQEARVLIRWTGDWNELRGELLS